MEIDVRTLAFEFLNFVVLVVLMRRFLFKPVHEVLSARRDEIEKRDHEVQLREAAAEAKAEEFAKRRAELDARADDLQEQARDLAGAQAREIVDEARRTAHHLTEAAEEEIEESRRLALDAIRDELAWTAVEVSRRVISEAAPPDLTAQYARRGVHLLQDRLGSALDGPIQAWVSPDADPDAIRRAIAAETGGTLAVTVEADDELVGGVRLRCGDLEVESSAGHSLSQWLQHRAAAGSNATRSLEATA